MNKFHRDSITERFAYRDYIAKANPHIISFSFTNAFKNDPYDFACTSGTTGSSSIEFVGEIKVRDHFQDNCPEGWILEQKKLNALLALNKPSLYINFFHDGYAIWRLNQEMILDLKPEIFMEKKVFYLPLSKASEIHRININYGTLFNKTTKYLKKNKHYNPAVFKLKK